MLSGLRINCSPFSHSGVAQHSLQTAFSKGWNKPFSYLSTLKLKIKRIPSRYTDIIQMMGLRWCNTVCVRAVLREAGLLLCCVVCALPTLSQVLSNRGCAQDGALQPLAEEERRKQEEEEWLYGKRKGEKSPDDWPCVLMALHPLSDCTETLVKETACFHSQRRSLYGRVTPFPTVRAPLSHTI